MHITNQILRQQTITMVNIEMTIKTREKLKCQIQQLEKKLFYLPFAFNIS